MRYQGEIDFQGIREDFDLECKKAAGRDGSGEVPKNLWESYSSMANTSGRVIFLGVEQKDDKFQIHGITNPEKLKKDLWDTLNNHEKISVNILSEKNIEILNIEEKRIIRIDIPQANRKQRPVFVGQNPYTGTFIRNYEGDYRCSKEHIDRMIADKIDESKDSKIFEDFSMDDIDHNSLKKYMNIFQNRSPSHPFLGLDAKEFLRNLGGYAKDRASGKEGLTLAGLLMFGKLRSILEAVPNYCVDYQERPRAITENRWVDRITTDFMWSGNLFDFYSIVILKLYEGLKIPFKLEGGNRIDDTPVHEAIREAFVNTLIHADYNGRVSILVVKRPDLFGFRNPGLSRVPVDDVKRGGLSDSRNRKLQKMFQLIGFGEQAGSGFPKIINGWESQSWKYPDFEQKTGDYEQTILTLRMENLLPTDSLDEIKAKFPSQFSKLNEIDRIALVTALNEGCVTHKRLLELSMEHSSDITKNLHKLVDKKLLDSSGQGRSTYYFLPGNDPINIESELFSSEHLGKSSEHLGKSSEHLGKSSEHFDTQREIDKLKKEVEEISAKKKVDKTVMEETILMLCEERYLTIRELAEILNRKPDSLRNNYINPLLDQDKLEMLHQNLRNHPDQKYIKKSLEK